MEANEKQQIERPEQPSAGSESAIENAVQSLAKDRQSKAGKGSVAVANEPVDNLLKGAWILQKVRALYELFPEAAIELENRLREGWLPRRIALGLHRTYGIWLDEVEVARYGSWLPRFRRDAMRRADERSEELVQQVKAGAKGKGRR